MTPDEFHDAVLARLDAIVELIKEPIDTAGHCAHLHRETRGEFGATLELCSDCGALLT